MTKSKVKLRHLEEGNLFFDLILFVLDLCWGGGADCPAATPRGGQRVPSVGLPGSHLLLRLYLPSHCPLHLAQVPLPIFRLI
jgi:hypothetical protein